MAEEKIASRIKDPVTKQEYYIGTRGSVERVALKLSVPDDVTVDWTTLTVTVQNESTGKGVVVPLSESGECVFEIPQGSRYAITLPYVEGQDQPAVMKYTALLANRNIDYFYSRNYEALTCRFVVRSEAISASSFNGQTVSVINISDGSIVTTNVIEQGQVTLLIPYGITYMIKVPEADGMAHDHNTTTYISGIQARQIVFSYIDYHALHVFGLDADGNIHTIADLQKMDVDVAKELIVAGGYTDAELDAVERTEGGKGCGFCWDINNPTVSGPWAAANVDFGVNNTIIAEAIANNDIAEACGYYTNHDLAFARKDGARESALVMQIGQLLADAGLLVQTNPTPIFRAASQRQCPIITTTNTGFILTHGQQFLLRSAQNELDELYAAIGRSNETPKLTSGYWWSSLQNNATHAVRLNGGGFSGNNKTNGYQALVGFDLP